MPTHIPQIRWGITTVEHHQRLLTVKLCTPTKEFRLKIRCVDCPPTHALRVLQTEQKVDAISHSRPLNRLAVALELDLGEKRANKMCVNRVDAGTNDMGQEQLQAHNRRLWNLGRLGVDSVLDVSGLQPQTHHVLQNGLELVHTPRVVVPHAFHSTQESVSLDRTLDRLCASTEGASSLTCAGAGKGGHNALLGKPVQVLCNQSLDPVVQLVSVCLFQQRTSAATSPNSRL